MKLANIKMWLLLFAVIFLIAAYLFQQSKTNQEQLQLQALKSIELSRINFLEAYEDYHAQLRSYLKRLFYSLSSNDPTSPASEMVARFDKRNRFLIQEIRYLSGQDSIDHVKHNRTVQLVHFDSTYIEEKNFLFQLEEKDGNGNFFTGQTGMKALFDNLNEDPLLKFKGIGGNTAESRTFSITHWISFFQLMKNNLNNRFFDEIYVVNREGEVLYPGSQQGLTLFHPADVFQNTGAGDEEDQMPGNVGNRKIKLQIHSVGHEAFIAPVRLGEEYFYLTGVKESEQFQKVALRIDFNLLSAFIIGLLLIFTCVPLFSICKMNVGDVLSRRKVYGLGLSLILFVFIIGFTLAFVRSQPADKLYDAETNRIEKSYQQNIQFFSQVLKDYNKEQEEDSTEVISANGLYEEINEYLEFDTASRVMFMNIPNIPPSGIALDFHENRFVSIANRDYAQFTDIDTNKYFISAHYSQATGLLEGVISKKDSIGKALTFNLEKTSPEESLNHRFFVFKSGGKILFKSERITVPVSYLQQAVQENKWEEIRTLMANNEFADPGIIWTIPIYVNGYEYLGRLKRLSMDNFDEPVWLLFLVNRNLDYVRSSLASLEAVVFSLAYVLFLIVLSFLPSIANKQNIYLSIRSFAFSWFSPSPAKRNQYLLLNYIIGVDILVLLMLYYFIPINSFVLFLWCTQFALHASICKFLLIYPKQSDRYTSEAYNYLAVMGVLWVLDWVLLSYLVYISPPGKWVFAVNILVGSCLSGIMAFCFYVIRFRRLPGIDPMEYSGNREGWMFRLHVKFTRFWNFITQTPVQKRIYSLCFLLWIILIGFLPAYLMYGKINKQETFIWNVSRDQGAYLDKTNGDWHPGFESLLRKYEEIRRVAFAGVTDQYDDQIRNFLFPKQNVLRASFTAPIESQIYLRTFVNSTDPFTKIFTLGLYLFNKMTTNLLFLVGLALVGFLLFKLIMRLNHRIFLTEYLFTYSEERIPESCKDTLFHFLLGMDNAVAIQWIYHHFGLQREHSKHLDSIVIEDWQEKTDTLQVGRYSAIIIENVHAIKDLGSFVQFLPKIILTGSGSNIPVFITSGKSYKELENQLAEENGRMVFSELLSPFIFHTVPIHFHLPSHQLPFAEKSRYKMDTLERVSLYSTDEIQLFKEDHVQYLNHEINYGPNARQVSALITKEIQKDPLDRPMSRERYEKCILTIQRYNKAYFINLWNELNFMEKKIVYYFATEGFINYTNRDTLTALIQKGVFILNREENGLVLFTLSFRNFVCQIVKEKEIKAFKQDEQKYGNAGSIQTAAISFVFISIAVISYYDPNILNRTSAYVSAVIGVFGTLYSFLSKGLNIFQGKHSKKEE